jgi:hypothetical protein
VFELSFAPSRKAFSEQDLRDTVVSESRFITSRPETLCLVVSPLSLDGLSEGYVFNRNMLTYLDIILKCNLLPPDELNYVKHSPIIEKIKITD